MFLNNTRCMNSETAPQVTDQVIPMQVSAKQAATAVGKPTFFTKAK